MKSLAKVLVLKSRRQQERDALLEQLLHEHGAALRLFLRFRLADVDEREDVLQDVFVRLLQQEDRLQQLRSDTVRSYLLAIAANLLRDRYRRAQVRQITQHDALDDVDEPAGRQQPELDLLESRALQQLEQALLKLPPLQRQAFLLNRIRGHSYREISEQLDVSVSSVEKYIAAALVWLRGELQ